MGQSVLVPKKLLQELLEHYYNPATDYRDPEGTKLWKELAERAELELPGSLDLEDKTF